PAILAYTGQWRLDETTSTDSNQFKASGYLDTGKLGQAVSMYGNAAGTAGSTLTFNRGAQISGNNYEHINTNQGTISFWVKPSWNGNDGVQHNLFSDGQGSQKFVIYTAGNSQLSARIPSNSEINIAGAATINSGSWYLVTLQWSKNTVDGTNYGILYLNNSVVSQTTTAIVPQNPVSSYYIGSFPATGRPANALIDDFAVFDRVLSTAEITSLYNAGTGNEAGYVADSSLKFYAKMDGTGTLQPVTYNGGASASKLTAKSTELTGGTNLVADGNMEAAGVANWTLGSGISVAKQSANNGSLDTQNITLNIAQNTTGYAYQDLTGLSAGANYYVSGMIMSGVYTPTTYLQIYSGTAGTPENTLVFSRSVTAQIFSLVDGAIKVQAGDDRLRVKLYVDCTGKAGQCDGRFDNVIVTPNLLDNGGMEVAGTGGADIWAGWTESTAGSSTLTDDTGTVHSGGHSAKFVVDASNSSVLIYQNFTTTVDSYYLLSFWVNGTAGKQMAVDINGFSTNNATTLTGSWQKVIYIFKAPSTLQQIGIKRWAASTTFYVDDVSVTPLDNVALSLKAWTPVGDSGGSSNSLSVQGSTTGVVSNATGIRNTAYTFDGSSGYLRQATIATNIDALYYDTNSFGDGGQNFSTYYTTSGNSTYMIVITNSDNTTTWGYLGGADGARVGNNNWVSIYQNKTRANAGWNGAGMSGKTPVGYEVRKTDYQITGSMSVGAWVKASGDGIILGKSDARGASTAGFVFATGYGSGNKFEFRVGTVINATDPNTHVSNGTTWYYVVGVYVPSTSITLYVNGSQVAQTTASVPASITDVYIPLQTNMTTGAGNNWFNNGSIDEPFVTTEVLTAAQIFDMYNSGR
ncbi:MAG: LamG domain-containing protein, partial [Candidatus Roizmanbacteria bacterium]